MTEEVGKRRPFLSLSPSLVSSLIYIFFLLILFLFSCNFDFLKLEDEDGRAEAARTVGS